VVPPKGAPNILLSMTGDVGFAAQDGAAGHQGEPMTATASHPARPRSRSTQEARPDHEVGDAVRQLVIALLPNGHPDIRCVAQRVRLSPRTLQRRLSDEGVSFARVVARAGLDAAQRMLADPTRKVIDVALDLGYSDQAHFARAFVRWTGLSPRKFQRRCSTGRLGAPFPQGVMLDGEKISPTKQVFALRPYHPSVRRVHQPAAVP
jgi:AraC-like DNA-binding protein